MSAFASLSTLLGERQAENFDLAEEPMPELLTNSASELIFAALANRPDLARSRYQRDFAIEILHFFCSRSGIAISSTIRQLSN